MWDKIEDYIRNSQGAMSLISVKHVLIGIFMSATALELNAIVFFICTTVPSIPANAAYNSLRTKHLCNRKNSEPE